MTQDNNIENSKASNQFSLQLEREHQARVVEYNDSAVSYPADKTFSELFVDQVARSPDDEAIRFGEHSLTYRELNERANQMAAYLCSLGVGPSQLVVLYFDHSIEVVCAILGVLKAGGAYVPVDPAIPNDRLTLILGDIAEGTAQQLPILVTQSRLVSGLPGDVAQVITLDADFASIAGFPVTEPPSRALPNDLAYVIFTSGSTGTPKGVMIEQRSLVNYIWWANEKYCCGDRLTWPLFSSLAFDLTVTSIFTPLLSGGRIVVYREDPGLHRTVIFKVLEEGVADIVKLTPAHLAMVKDLGLRGFVWVNSAGETV